MCDGSVNMYYDVDAGEYVFWDTTNSYTSPVAFGGNGSSSGGYQGSVYATYEAAAVGNNNGYFRFF